MPRTKEQNKQIREKTRSQILDKALSLFATKGYHGTSISDIAISAGISKGLAYNYFSSKQNIAEAILKQLLDDGEDFIRITEQESDSYKQLNILIDYSFDYLIKNEHFWQLYLSLALQPEIFETAREIINQFSEKMNKKFEQIFRKLGIKNPATEARLFGAMFDGIGIHYFFDKNKYPLTRVKRLFHEKYSKSGLDKLR